MKPLLTIAAFAAGLACAPAYAMTDAECAAAWTKADTNADGAVTEVRRRPLLRRSAHRRQSRRGRQTRERRLPRPLQSRRLQRDQDRCRGATTWSQQLHRDPSQGSAACRRLHQRLGARERHQRRLARDRFGRCQEHEGCRRLQRQRRRQLTQPDPRTCNMQTFQQSLRPL